MFQDTAEAAFSWSTDVGAASVYGGVEVFV